MFTDRRFDALSTDAKLLYGMLIDRMELSVKNGWIDEQGRIYLYFTIDEVKEKLNCGNDKAVKLLKELDSETGIGLLESIRQGLGKPNRIYVKNFASGDEREGKDRIDMISMIILSLNNINIITFRFSEIKR